MISVFGHYGVSFGEGRHREIIQEIDHTDTREFRKLLQDKLALLEQIGAKFGALRSEAAIH